MDKSAQTSLKENNEKIHSPGTIDEEDSMIDWWADTVILTLFPTLVSVFISLLRYQRVDVERMIGDGEVIMLSCLIIIPSLMNYYRDHPIKKNINHRRYFYIMLFMSFFQLLAYASFKTNPQNVPAIVYSTSAGCFLGSVVISYRAEKFLRRHTQ